MREYIYEIEHRTHYAHAGRVATSQHIACLEPRVLPHQRLLSHELVTAPAAASVGRRIDYFGNTLHQVTILTPYTDLTVVSRGRVGVKRRHTPKDADGLATWEDVRDRLVSDDTTLDASVVECCYASPYVSVSSELADYARPSFTSGRGVIPGAIDLMGRIHRGFTFLPNATTITTPVTRVLAERHGVCQDFAHLQIACLRSLGLAARYVSGYLLTDPPPGQPRLVGADASHAWLSVFCPVLGWVDLDPTNDVLPDVRHITIGWGRDYGDVSPLRGVVLGGDDHTLEVGVTVRPSTDP